MRGNSELLDLATPDSPTKFLCVVGPRRGSQYGIDVCKELILGLRGHNIVVVSGLALGIDAVAHQAALDSGLRTLAVVASGLDFDSLYPKSNQNLAKEILANGGTIISEFGSGYSPRQYNFPERNRIMAGICHAALVIEAKPLSGTLITARLALDYNRDVFAVPGSIFSEYSEGTNELISKGAMLVSKSRDILAGLGINFDEQTAGSKIANNLSSLELTILKTLSEPLSRSELVKRISENPQEITAAISSLEIKKLITESAGLLRQKFA